MSRLIDALRACAVAVFLVLALGACASTSGPGGAARTPSPADPLEPLNRGVYAFNEVVDEFFMRPLAVAYDKYMPDVLQLIARNFLSNLYDPYIGLNNLLQGKPKEAISDIGRFLVNTTIGFLGFGDPASDIGMQKHREDFGQTLGVWGVPTGPYLVLPIFGPSDLRDGVGFGVDAWAGLTRRFPNVPFRNSVAGLTVVQARAQLLNTDGLLADALDRYLLVRDVYLQRRRNLIYDGILPEEE
jgi:phospholipid-binding lipoprotein MlaA